MANESVLLNLKILSPSTELEGGVNFPDLPASTTISELRQRIHDEAPSQPTADRMRLIYRGRVVAGDNVTLADIFGLDNIRSSKDQSLHLVLKEFPSAASAPSPTPRPATVPPNPFRQAHGPPQSPLQTNPFRTLPEPRANLQAHTPQPHHHHHPHMHAHHHHHHVPPPLPANLFPVPPHLQQQIAHAVAQNAQPGHGQPPASNGDAATSGSEEGAPAQQAGTMPPPPPPPPPPMGLPNLPTNLTRAVRHERQGPNGERWTVTWQNIAIPLPNPQQIPIRPFPQPPQGLALPGRRTPSPALGNMPDQTLARIRGTMEYARQEMENARVLLQPPGGQAATVDALAAMNPPAWRMDQIRQAVRNLITDLDNVDRGLLTLVDNPLMAQNRDFLSLQQSAAELRARAAELSRMLERLPGSNSDVPASSSSTSPLPDMGTASASGQSAPPNIPTELFILSSPQGPVGLLFDQRGTYSTTPIVPTLPFQNFTQQFAANRQALVSIGQQIVQNSIRLPHQPVPQIFHNAQPTQGAAQPLPNQGQDMNQNQVQVQNQNQNQNQNPAQVAAAGAGQEERVANVAGHIWLLLKLAFFVYFFAGGGGWYRPVMMCVIAGVVYIAQMGIFGNQLDAVRQQLRALVPLGEQADDEPNGAGIHGPGRRREPGRNLSPAEAAQRLQQQHRDQRFGWVRESMRATERAFAIFVASLWPGIGEEMVQIQEERAQAERTAEEQRLEELARRREEEERAAQEDQPSEKSGEREQESSSGEAVETRQSKGKERAREDDEVAGS